MAAEFSHVGVVTLCAEDDGGYSLRNNLTGESAAVPLRGVCELVVAADTTSYVINDTDERAWSHDICELKVVVLADNPTLYVVDGDGQARTLCALMAPRDEVAFIITWAGKPP